MSWLSSFLIKFPSPSITPNSNRLESILACLSYSSIFSFLLSSSPTSSSISLFSSGTRLAASLSSSSPSWRTFLWSFRIALRSNLWDLPFSTKQSKENNRIQDTFWEFSNILAILGSILIVRLLFSSIWSSLSFIRDLINASNPSDSRV